MKNLDDKKFAPGTELQKVIGRSRYVARIGGIQDWACYYADAAKSQEEVSRYGDKLSQDNAYKIFPELKEYSYRG